MGGEFVKLSPLRKTGQPSDVADAVIYLATAEFHDGHTLVVVVGERRKPERRQIVL